MKTIQQQTEEKTYQVIEDIAEELNVSVPFYPEVYYVKKNMRFETLGLPEIERESFESVRSLRGNVYLFEPKIILIGNTKISHVSEEAGHFLHFTNAKFKFSNKNIENLLALYSIIEMIGYFCSKLIDSDRKNFLEDYPDIIDEREKCMEKIEKRNRNIQEFWIYQQRYGLGERLFNHYISNSIDKKNIRKLFIKDFEKPNESLITFLRLKYNTLL